MREPGIKAPGSIAPASESQESALSIHNQIIAAGRYPKSTQVVQQMLRKPEHPNHPTDINKNVLDFLLKKRNLVSALRSLGFEIENRKVIGVMGIAD